MAHDLGSTFRRTPAWAFLALSLTVASCTESRSGFDVSVVVDATLKIEQLVVHGEIPGASTDPLIAPTTSAVLLVVPEGWAGEEATVIVKGIAGGKVVAQGQATSTVRAGELRQVVVFLGDGCEAACSTPGQSQCVGDGLRRCEKRADGCVVWSPAVPCPTDKPFCSANICEKSCTDECDDGQRRCAGQGAYLVCGQHDSDRCREWGAALACAPGELCEDGACSPQCDGKPCPCNKDETQPCDNLGQCKGGERHCIDGAFGPCQWKTGPTAEICDGKDNDCNGVKDDQLRAPACKLQGGVCAGAKQRCDGGAGWIPCGASDYEAAAASSGLSYEANEISCDGKDNDCDGKTDEPQSCQGGPCGDGVCSGIESALTCPADCPGDLCGDGQCKGGETFKTCPKDCLPEPCGDGECTGGETPKTCPKDCGEGPCGDGTCGYFETAASCPADCPVSDCVDKATRCIDTYTIEVCLSGALKRFSCETVCRIELLAPPQTCRRAADTQNKDLCDCDAAASTAGIPCKNHGDCLNGGVCAMGRGATDGYCTTRCAKAGTPCVAAFPKSLQVLVDGVCTVFDGRLGCDGTCVPFLAVCPSHLQCVNAHCV